MNARNDMLIDETNPLLQDWLTPYQLPPFEAVLPEHFAPAFGVAMTEHLVELVAIASNWKAP
jgi:peptidyl-dipeptidase Dcp